MAHEVKGPAVSSVPHHAQLAGGSGSAAGAPAGVGAAPTRLATANEAEATCSCLEALLPDCIMECIRGLIAWFTNLLSEASPYPALLPLSALEQEAIAFAEAELQAAGPETLCTIVGKPAYVPIGNSGMRDDPLTLKIHQLLTLYGNALTAFESPLAGRSVTDEASKAAWKKCIYLAYAIGYFTLQDLPSFINWHYEWSKGTTFPVEKRYTSTGMITDVRSYQKIALSLVGQMYQRMRGHLTWDRPSTSFIYPQEVPEEHAARFYQEGTLENSCRELHNNLCKQIMQFISPAEVDEWHRYHLDLLKEDHQDLPFRADIKLLAKEHDPFSLMSYRNNYLSASLTAAMLNPQLAPLGMQIRVPGSEGLLSQ
ncbi:MAG: hypothetical protein HYX48_07705 [Chlamydiales bacterium]|nr:hypothetical protein [Chlamydiales bacterium]